MTLTTESTLADLDDRERPAAEPPTKIGRFVVIGRLSAGGMGVVYSAYDPDLDRKVAIKLLRHTIVDPASRTRLQREARAMARLSDPHVVAVHDVAEHEGELFIAMELVKGTTLREWLQAAPRDWREVVLLMRQAGQGLAAAHAAEIVHRDFKPENVLVDERSRARVTDFGLARSSTAPADVRPAAARHPQSTVAGEALDGLTEHGAVIGTPAYMAPEQIMGRVADTQSDQFSFCVVVWEALYAMRPFQADNLVELAIAMQEGPPAGPADRRGVPRWVHAVIERGLLVDESARWPSMSALLVALGRDPRRRRRMAGAAGIAATLALAGAVGTRVARARGIDACEQAGQAMVAEWNDTTRTAAASALLSVPASSFADDAWARSSAHIDRFTGDLSRVRTQACIAAEVEGTRSDEDYARVIECLEARRLSLDVLLSVMQVGDPSMAAFVVHAVTSMPLVAACENDATLRQRVPASGDPFTRVAIAEVRAHVCAVMAALTPETESAPRRMPLRRALGTATRRRYAIG